MVMTILFSSMLLLHATIAESKLRATLASERPTSAQMAKPKSKKSANNSASSINIRRSKFENFTGQ